jgi:hypothetical protein
MHHRLDSEDETRAARSGFLPVFVAEKWQRICVAVTWPAGRSWRDGIDQPQF